MEQVLRWSALQALINPHYYREEGRGPGHSPIGLERSIYCSSGAVRPMKRCKLKAMHERPLKEITTRVEHRKAKPRSRVEHPFHVVKNRFGHPKVRHRV